MVVGGLAAINAEQFTRLVHRVVAEQSSFVAILDAEARLVAAHAAIDAGVGPYFEIPALAVFLAGGEVCGRCFGGLARRFSL